MSDVQPPATVVAGLTATLLLSGFVVTEAQAAGAGHKPRAQAAQRNASHTTQVQRPPGYPTRQRNTTWSNSNGRQMQVESVTQRTEDGYSRDVTRTLPSGQVNERSIDVSCDAAVRTCTKTVVGSRGE